MSDAIIGSVGVAVTPDARNFWRDFEARTSAGAAEAGRRAGRDWQREFDAATRNRDTVRVRADTTQARAEVAALNRQIDQLNRDTSRGGLLTYLAGIAPAIVPIAGAATAAGAAFAAMGVNAVLAVKGASAAMKAGTPIGMQYAAGVASIKGGIDQLEATAARGVLTGFNAGVAKAQAAIPGLNADLAKSSSLLGDIGSNAAGVAVGLAQDVAPAVSVVEKGLGRLTDQAERWANGPGGQRFGQAIAQDFQQVEPAVEHLVELIAHLVAAANGPGLGIVHLIDEIAVGLDHIPQGVLEPLITGLSALKIASVVSGYFDRLKLSVAGTAVAERDAALAAERAAIAQGDLGAAARASAAAQAAAGDASRLRSFGSLAVGVLGKVTAGWLVTSIAADAAAKATQGWAESSNTAKQFVGELTSTLSDLVHFNFSKVGSDLFGSQQQQWAQAAAFSTNVSKALTQAETDRYNIEKLTIDQDGNLAAVQGDLAGKLTITAQSYREYNTVLRQTTDAIKAQRQALSAHLSADLPSQAPSDLQAATKALQGNITATEKFLTLGGETKETYHGVSIGVKTYGAALAQTNGDVVKAQALIHGAVDSLGRQKSALAAVQAQQKLVNKYVSDSAIITGKMTGAQNQSNSSQSAAAKQYELTAQQVDAYTQALGINLNRLSKSPAYEQAAEDALRRFVGELVNGNTALTAWVNAVSTFNQSNKTAADRAQLIGAALVSFNGDAIAFQGAINQSSVAAQQFASDLHNVGAGIVNVQRGTINFHRAGAAPLLSDLQQMQTAGQNAAAAMYQHEVSIEGSKKAAADAAKVYRDDTYKALVQQATQLGLTKDAAHHLAQEYFGMPKNVVTRIKQLGADTTNNLLKAIGRQLSYLTGRPFEVHIDTSSINAAIGALQTLNSLIPGAGVLGAGLGVGVHHRASGGGAPDGWYWTGEQGPELNYKHGPMVQVYSAPVSRALAPALGTTVPGFAGGTQGSLLALARQYWHGKDAEIAAAVAMAESGGNAHAHNYNPSTGDDSYGLWQDNIYGPLRSRLKTYHIGQPSNLYNPQVNARVAHAIWAGSGWSNWTTYRDGAYLQYMGNGGTIHGGGSGGGSGGGGTTRAERRAQHRAAVQSARQGARSDAQAINSLPHSLQSVRSANAAIRPVFNDLRHLGLSDHDLTQLRRERKELDADIKQRIADADALNKARAKLHAATQKFNQEIKTVASATRSGFDITQAGQQANGKVTFGSIKAQEVQALAVIKHWAAGIKKLGREGFNKSAAGRAMLQQLAEAGPSTWPQVDALLHATPKELAGLINTEKAIDAQAKSLGQYEARHLYGHQVAQDRRQVNQDKRALERDRREIKRDLRQLDRRLVHALNGVFGHGIELRVDARGHARLVKKGEHQRTPGHPRSQIRDRNRNRGRGK